MKSSDNLYESSRLAAAYAHGRPPVHQLIMRKARQFPGFDRRFCRALDVGCGPGFSTVVLESLAETVIGLEPMKIMLAHRHEVAPQALFLVSKAERLPFLSGGFDLITAAGSLNYVQVDQFLAEVERVLAPDGVLLIYDFAAGRRMNGDCRLENWFFSFENRYPSPPSNDLSVRGFAYHNFGLRLREFEKIEVTVPLTFDEYLSYIMSQTSVESAISRGAKEKEIHAWCRERLEDLFGSKSRDVIFSAYIAYVSRCR